LLSFNTPFSGPKVRCRGRKQNNRTTKEYIPLLPPAPSNFSPCANHSFSTAVIITTLPHTSLQASIPLFPENSLRNMGSLRQRF
jgi:hypothetical protein